jgi:hypothetical protein
MSHPQPGHDYSEQTEHESDKEYKGRRSVALHKKMNAAQKSNKKMLGHAGKHLRKEGEAPLQHLKRLLK